MLKNSKIISCSLVWQLLTIWQSRLKPLFTVYKYEKISAIKSYLQCDWEYLKIRKEINKFKTKDRYDFKGIQMPVCVITPDYFLNVFKPHVENLSYHSENIIKFYEDQKKIYKTLIYCKDVCVSGEPKYIGGHITTHGLTYFYNEIMVSKGDVVIDLGSAPGDFAALAAYYGASKIYAFEPEENKKSDLEKLSTMNDNIIEVVRKYCNVKTDITMNTISLDDFFNQQGLDRIDFIKADIEGNEANMLRGAVEILKTSQPKLAICSYHLENDENELREIILSANEKYTIYKENGILYAF
jgi:septum formation topological specificity factor MinE